MGVRIDTQRTLFRGLGFEWPHALDVDERTPAHKEVAQRARILVFQLRWTPTQNHYVIGYKFVSVYLVNLS